MQGPGTRSPPFARLMAMTLAASDHMGPAGLRAYTKYAVKVYEDRFITMRPVTRSVIE